MALDGVGDKAIFFGMGAALGAAMVSENKTVVFGAGAAVGAAALFLARRQAVPPHFGANPTAGPLIYMDYNATTPIDPRVATAMVPFLGAEGWGNPSSSHALGKRAKAAVERARAQVAALVGAARADEVVFLSGGTESINWCLGSVVRRAAQARGIVSGARPRSEAGGGGSMRRPHLITAHTEHVAVLETAAALEAEGLCDVTYLPVDEHGRVSAAQVAAERGAAPAVASFPLPSKAAPRADGVNTGIVLSRE